MRRVWLVVPVAVALVAGAAAGLQTLRSDPAGAVPLSSFGVPLEAGHSGKCLNVSGASTADSAPVIQYRCTGTALNERWKPVQLPDSNLFVLQAEHSGKCLNVSGASTANKAAVVQYRCIATAQNELWFTHPRTSDAATVPTAPVVATAGGAPGDPIRIAYVNRNGNGFSASVFPGEDPSWTPLPASQRLTGQLALAGPGQLLAVGRNRIVWGLDLDRTGADWVDTGDPVDNALVSVPFAGKLAVFGSNHAASPQLLRTDGVHVPFLGVRPSPGLASSGALAATPAGTGVQLFDVVLANGAVRTGFLGADESTGTTVAVGTDSTIIGGPAAATLPGNRFVVAVNSSAGRAELKWQAADGGWPATWTELPGVTPSGTPRLVLDATGRLNVVARGTDGLLRVATETAAGSRAFGAWATASTTASVSDPGTVTYTDLDGTKLWGITGRTADDQPFLVTVRPPAAAATAFDTRVLR